MKEKINIFIEKLKESNIVKNKKALYSVGLIVLVIIGVLIFNLTRTSNSLKGFDDYKLSMDMNFDQVYEKLPESSIDTKTDGSLRYKALSFCGRSIKDVFFSFDDKTKKISYISIDMGDIEAKDAIEMMNKVYGNPIHKENYNDKRRNIAKIAWDVGNDVLAYMDIYTKSESFEVKFSKIDEEYQSIKPIELKDNNLFNELKEKVKYYNHPITEVIDTLNAEYNGKDSSQEYSIYFDVKTKLMDYDIVYQYGVESPYSDSSIARFVGEINNIKGTIELNREAKQEDIIKTFTSYLGEADIDEKSTKTYTWNNTPIDISLSFDDKTAKISLYPNRDYYKINSAYGSTDDLDKYYLYDDVDLKILHCENDTTSGYLASHSNNYKRLAGQAESVIKEHLKYPLTATITTSSVYKSANEYIVKGSVTSENGFGVPSKDSYTLYFEVENGILKFQFGDIGGNLM